MSEDDEDPTWEQAVAALKRATPVEIVPLTECDECYAIVSPQLIGACASVGIEHGKPTKQMVREYLAAYHERGHLTA